MGEGLRQLYCCRRMKMILYIEPLVCKRNQLISFSTETKISFSTETKEVCDVLIKKAKYRFQFTGHLLGSKLFYLEKFNEYEKKNYRRF